MGDPERLLPARLPRHPVKSNRHQHHHPHPQGGAPFPSFQGACAEAELRLVGITTRSSLGSAPNGIHPWGEKLNKYTQGYTYEDVCCSEVSDYENGESVLQGMLPGHPLSVTNSSQRPPLQRTAPKNNLPPSIISPPVPIPGPRSLGAELGNLDSNQSL